MDGQNGTRSRTATAVCILIFGSSLALGCTQPALSMTPSQVPLPTSRPSGPSPTAILTVEFFDVEQQPEGWFASTFALRETGGQSAASLQSVGLSVPEQSCSYPLSGVVPAGGVLTLSAPPWCFDGDFDITDMDVSLEVGFADDGGRRGTVRGETIAHGAVGP